MKCGDMLISFGNNGVKSHSTSGAAAFLSHQQD
ncbi:hypothetical protein IOK_03346 [Yersinia enterocolitica subsp. palearctica PhRBD_Ye1]|nr:hypothetical protein IOK_03346 [Yersinia enterocolitica subsp. palearctica PhRBD_Ye1]